MINRRYFSKKLFCEVLPDVELNDITLSNLSMKTIQKLNKIGIFSLTSLYRSQISAIYTKLKYSKKVLYEIFALFENATTETEPLSNPNIQINKELITNNIENSNAVFINNYKTLIVTVTDQLFESRHLDIQKEIATQMGFKKGTTYYAVIEGTDQEITLVWIGIGSKWYFRMIDLIASLTLQDVNIGDKICIWNDKHCSISVLKPNCNKTVNSQNMEDNQSEIDTIIDKSKYNWKYLLECLSKTNYKFMKIGDVQREMGDQVSPLFKDIYLYHLADEYDYKTFITKNSHHVSEVYKIQSLLKKIAHKYERNQMNLSDKLIEQKKEDNINSNNDDLKVVFTESTIISRFKKENRPLSISEILDNKYGFEVVDYVTQVLTESSLFTSNGKGIWTYWGETGNIRATNQDNKSTKMNTWVPIEYHEKVKHKSSRRIEKERYINPTVESILGKISSAGRPLSLVEIISPDFSLRHRRETSTILHESDFFSKNVEGWETAITNMNTASEVHSETPKSFSKIDDSEHIEDPLHKLLMELKE